MRCATATRVLAAWVQAVADHAHGPGRYATPASVLGVWQCQGSFRQGGENPYLAESCAGPGGSRVSFVASPELHCFGGSDRA